MIRQPVPARLTQMPSIHVCSLSRVATTVAASEASHLVTFLHMPVERPASIPAERHLYLSMADIVGPVAGLTEPADDHIHRLLDFVGEWDRARPMVIHCFAGISRSTAGAFVALCHLLPDVPEADLAKRLRNASAVATPNVRIVEIADGVMKRDGRMIDAINKIGPGEISYESEPFVLPLGEMP